MSKNRASGDMASEETIMTAAEYSESVYQWLQQAYQWQALAVGFPTYMAYQSALQQQSTNTLVNNNSSQASVDPNNVSTTNSQQPNQSPQPHQGAATRRIQTPSPPVWREFRIPPLWKRASAEIIDFSILFLLKVVVTFVAVDYFELLDLDRYDKALLLAATGSGDIDFATAMEVTSDILLLEIIHKFIVCIFEALCTHRGIRGLPGGATPGKFLMGLRIYTCDQIAMLPEPNHIQIIPATDLGVFWACLRSLLKNVASTFFFPAWLTIFLSPHRRAIYDVMSRTIVLEAPPRNNNR